MTPARRGPGRWRPGPRTGRLPVVDPATGETFDEAPDQQPDALDEVVARARRAWHAWRADPEARTAALRGAADAVETAGEDLARLLTREQGKPLAESHAEVARTAARLRYFADLAPDPPDRRRPARGQRGPLALLGPVAAIVPWNFPLQLAAASSRPRSRRATPWSSSPRRSHRSPPGCSAPSSPRPCPRTS
ncbi:aldehyde dehydrogenase family protein [Streptomyces diastatochromogenes]|nr:aldehyde dehydrogenase family protein [Streptomyces diastatochromogenes]